MKRSFFLNALAALFLTLSFTISFYAQTKGWGYSPNGEIGAGFIDAVQTNPQPVQTAAGITGLGGGFLFSTFLVSDGTVLTAGDNRFGELGNGLCETLPRRTPQAVVNLTDVIQVSGGTLHALAVKADGTVWAWGDNVSGTLGGGGLPAYNDRCNPVPVRVPRLNNVVQVKAGDYYSLALRADGTIWAWGANGGGALGDGTRIDRSTPVRVGVGVAGFEDIISISAGDNSSIALKSDGTVWEWGNGKLRPVQNPVLSNITQINAANALRRDGTVWVWGVNSVGRFGNGTFGGITYRPPAQSSISNVLDVKEGNSHIVALKNDGTVWSWGANSWGQMGNGTVGTIPGVLLPVQSFAGAGNISISASWFRSLAVRPVLTTFAGSNVYHYGEKVILYFSTVTVSGSTVYTPVDPSSTGLNVPAGLTIARNQPAYEVSSSAATSGDIDICIKVNEFDRERFSRLRLLHAEGANLVDRTTWASYIRRQICARADSLSTFVMAKQALPLQSATVSGRVLGENGLSVSGANISLTDSNGNVRTTRTNLFGNYQFAEVGLDTTYTLGVTAKRFQANTQQLTVDEDFRNVNVMLSFIGQTGQ